MSETSPTEKVDGGAGSSDEDLPAQNQNPSADEQQPDSDSSDDSQGSDQDDNNQPQPGSTDDDSSSSDDDGLNKFAKSQGIENVSELSEREKSLLKVAHDNQKAFRTDSSKKAEELKKATEDVHNVEDSDLEDLDPTDARDAKRDSEIASLRAETSVTNFYIRNPEATEFDQEMGEIVLEEAKRHGKDAARYLAADLDRLLILAKARRGMSEEDAKAQGAREERERLRNRQEGSADSGQAQQSNRSSKKITREDISNMSDEDYEKFRDSGDLQKAIDRGDLY